MQYNTLVPSDLEPAQFQKLLLSMIIPRPIGFISTLSADGIPNLAPFSYFQAISAVPPAIMFATNRDRNGRIKDSLHNVQQTGEFVANAVTEEMAEAMNLTSADFPPDVSEFEAAGFTQIESDLVKPFRVAESPINLECSVIKIVELSDQPLGGSIVIGKIVKVHIRSDIFNDEKNVIRANLFNPISRLGGAAYGKIGERFNMLRPKMDAEGKVVKDSHRILPK